MTSSTDGTQGAGAQPTPPPVIPESAPDAAQAAQATPEPSPRPHAWTDTNIDLDEPADARRRGRPWLMIPVALAAALLGALVVRFAVPPPIVSEDTANDIAEQVDAARAAIADADIDDLRERVAKLEQSVSPASSSGLRVVTARLDAVEKTVAELRASLQTLQGQTPAAPMAEGAISGEAAADAGAMPAGMNGELAALGARIDKLAADLSAANQELDVRIGAMERSVPAGIGETIAALPKASDFALLDQRVKSLEENTAAQDARRAAAAIALANLARAANSGDPFTNELQAVRLLDLPEAQIAEIAIFAPTGVRSETELVAELPAVARRALRAQSSQGTWWDRLVAHFRNMVLVRRKGALQGGTVEAIISRAELAAEDGNLSAATKELGALTGAPAEAAADWRVEAEARAKLDQLLGDLSASLIADLGR